MGSAVCNININYLDSLSASSQNVILGGMFFQEFFGVFENDYLNQTDATQSAQIYLG